MVSELNDIPTLLVTIKIWFSNTGGGAVETRNRKVYQTPTVKIIYHEKNPRSTKQVSRFLC